MTQKLIIIICFLVSGLALAAPDPACQEVHLADAGWTDSSATTAVAAALLKAQGYSPKISLLSLPVILASMANGQVDVFLGNWMPSQSTFIDPYLDKKQIEVLSQNLDGAKYTLAVPEYVYNAGVHSFSDLHKYAPRFDNKVYGIEPGSDGNTKVLKMFKDPALKLSGWSLVESSEQAMLSAVRKAVPEKEWIVFEGWSPHPMNIQIPMRYLDGDERYFGPNYGASKVFTIANPVFAKKCPVPANFLKGLHFSVQDENELMLLILEEGLSPKDAARTWLTSHPTKVKDWLGAQNASLFQDFASEKTADSLIAGFSIPLGTFAENGIQFLTDNFSSEFLLFSQTVENIIQTLISALLKLRPLLAILLLTLALYFWRRSIWLSLGVCFGFMLILSMGLWAQTIETLVLVLLATLFSCALGIPLGVWASKNKAVYQVLSPILDLMQTLPTFVYLIPTLMLFGLGIVPGLISTVIFAIAAPIRLTHLGLTQVPRELLEVGDAFGASKWQRFYKIELPHAMPSILTGLNQCILLSLSMVVIAALVGANGLGTSVVRALNTVNVKQGFEAGLAIVILALILDRTLRFKQGSP
ncbi:MAG: ABC transporter permease subunit [Deltaproteobacteria bacterium]|nr:ABC transporter permease subunit [Deltaproteobacteria bacterium]